MNDQGSSARLVGWRFNTGALLTWIMHKTGLFPPPREITVVFRFDDYSNNSPPVVEQTFLSLYSQYQIPFTLGVVPYSSDPGEEHGSALKPLSTEKVLVLQSALQTGVADLALHGYTHQCLPGVSDLWYTEFKTVDYATQLEWISLGKSFLEDTFGVQIETFIPPWNTYDEGTIQAIQQLGFKCLSAGPHGEVPRETKLLCLPATTTSHHLKAAIERARRLPDASPTIVVLFHTYDYFETDHYNYQRFQNLLAWLREQEDVHVCNISQITCAKTPLHPTHLARYRSYLAPPAIIPKLFHLPIEGVYPSHAGLSRMYALTWLLAISFYLGISFLSLGATCWLTTALSPLISGLLPAYRATLTAILILFSLYGLRDLAIGVRGAIAIAASIGALLGLWLLAM